MDIIYIRLDIFFGGNVDKYFFIIDSNNLDSITTKLYGYAINDEGIILDSEKNFTELPDSGAYIFIDAGKDEIKISQDFIGSYGIYCYRKDEYFALSNSFLYLMEYLRDNHENMSFNRDYAHYYLSQSWVSNLSAPTLVNEITMLPEDIIVHIDKSTGNIDFEKNRFKEKYVPINSKDALDILDKWFLKWVGVIRSVRKKSNSISLDLSGGFDSRVVASIWLNANIDLTRIRINSLDLPHMAEDFEIAQEISRGFGFQINNDLIYDRKTLNPDESLKKSRYVNFGFKKKILFRKSLPTNPTYRISGHCGEIIRNYKRMSSDEYKILISKIGYNFDSNFRYSCEKLLNEEYEKFLDDYDGEYLDKEFGSILYKKARCRNHFGNEFTDHFLHNNITLAPLSDSELQKIDFKTDIKENNLLIALIITRYCPELMDYKFEGGKSISSETLKACDKINSISPFKMPEYDFIEGPAFEEITPVENSSKKYNLDRFKEIFYSKTFENEFKRYFPEEIYYKIQNNIFKGHDEKMDIIGCIEVIKTIHDINAANRPGNLKWIEWLNSYPADAKVDSHDVKASVLLNKFREARLDIKNVGEKDNAIEIVEISDNSFKSNYQKWLKDYHKKDCVISSLKTSLDFKIRVINDGMLRVKLRTQHFKDKNGKLIPIFIDYSSLNIDGEEILKNNQLVCFDEPFVYKMDVSDSQIIDFHVEWLPVNDASVFHNRKVETLMDENESLRNENKSLMDETESLKEKNRILQRELHDLNSKKLVKIIKKL